MTADDIVRAAGAIAAAAVSIVGLSSVTVARLAPPPDAIELIAPALPTTPCGTDAECYELNPHIAEPGHDELFTPMGAALEGLGYQPCEHEDGPGPCYWDASVRGNGEGRSFVVDTLGAAVYLDGES